MKARVKATGEIVEVMYSTEMGVGTSNGVYLVQDLEEIESDYWTRLEHQAVINIYCAYVENNGSEWSLDEAIIEAHALVEKMKEVRK